ncbi:MAG: CDP-alcohol phosphatidyltransferase family protein [Acidobacteriota bacterium]|jgi:cardiolipin synthase|nr:CDP-alcohol phosphatidyltransferase family protein [Acidobacteriota bacterium]MDQ3372506.1 CDP-alcohol phosphatidyltransferase family protein [Acidobacteriota bacterium]
MASNIITIPNLLTFLRMALIPVFAILLYYGQSGWALMTFLVAGISDGVDGFVARRFNQQSELGTILDPIADKLLMTTAFIIMTLPNVFPPTRHLPVPFWVTASVIGRDILIIAVAGAIFIITNFRGFKPSWLGKASTVVQIVAVCLILIAAVFPVLRSFYLPTVYTSVVALALFSGVHYIFFVAKLMNENTSQNIESV